MIVCFCGKPVSSLFCGHFLLFQSLEHGVTLGHLEFVHLVCSYNMYEIILHPKNVYNYIILLIHSQSEIIFLKLFKDILAFLSFPCV